MLAAWPPGHHPTRNDLTGPWCHRTTKICSHNRRDIRHNSSLSIVTTFFPNDSCNTTYASPPSPYTFGNYVVYAINVSGPARISIALKYGQEHNNRPAIRNTGHDYYGKLTGAGVLSIWTHNLKEASIIQANSELYCCG